MIVEMWRERAKQYADRLHKARKELKDADEAAEGYARLLVANGVTERAASLAVGFHPHTLTSRRHRRGDPYVGTDPRGKSPTPEGNQQ